MSLRKRHKHPPDPGITSPLDSWSISDGGCIYTLLADIDKCFNDTVNPTATSTSACSQKLYNECNRTWEAIQSFSLRLTELRVNYHHVEGYRDLIRDIQRAVNSNTLTEAETDGFICRLNNSFYDFERAMKDRKTNSLYRADSVSGPNFFRNVDSVDIQHSNLTMNNHLMDPGVSNHLKHIKAILIIQTTVLF